MTDIFKNFKNKYIPIVNWTFFPSLKKGNEYYNTETFSGWNEKWKPIASNDLGDVIIINDNVIYEIDHETSGDPELSLISKDIEKLIPLFTELRKYKEFSEKDSIEILKNKKQNLIVLKKMAPRPLKFNFGMEIDDIQEAISDKRWLKTKDGKFYQALMDFTKLVYPELRKNGRFEWVMISRNFEKRIFTVGGMLHVGEDGDEAIKIIKKYESPYPIEFLDFKPFDEKYT